MPTFLKITIIGRGIVVIEEGTEFHCLPGVRATLHPNASNVVNLYPLVLHPCHQGYISTYRLGRQLQTHRRPSGLS